MAAPRQPTTSAQVPRVLERLLAERRITREQHEATVQSLRRHGGSLDDALIDATGLPEGEVLKLLAATYRTRFVSTERLANAGIERSILDLVPRKTAERYGVVPILFDTANASLAVVTADPDNVQALEEVKVVARVRSVSAMVARAAAVSALVRKFYLGELNAFAALDRKRDEPMWPQMADVFERQQAASAVATEGAMGAAQLQRALGRPQHVAPLELDHANAGHGSGRAAEAPRTSETSYPTKVPSLAPPAAQAPPFPRPQKLPEVPTAEAPRPSPPPDPLRASSERAPSAIGMSAWLETLNVLVSLLENNRPDLRGHSAQVARLTRKFCERLGLAEKDTDELVAAAHLHDLGKASSYHLTALNVAQYEGHRTAARKSFLTPSRLMAGMKLPDPTIRALNHMYERFDGTGFPDGLGGKDIPLGARVLAIADTYADLTQNPRNPYRKALRPIEASDVLAKFRGTIFDVNLVDIFRHVVTGDDLKAKLLASRRSVLLVDPDPEETTVLELRMVEQGFEVKIARTSEQAIKAIGEGEIELVVSEVELPSEGGFELFERAKSLEGARAATWVFLSSRTDRDSIDRGFALGAADYVEKPVRAEILVAKLRKLLEQGAPARAGAARGVAGSLEEMGFPELVQILSQGRKTGALRIRANGESGEIHFVAGEIFHAAWARLRGEDAFYAMCRLRKGEFALDPNVKAEARTITMSAEGLLLEGMRRFDEESRADARLPR